ncbi:MAC/perforin domain-containing protein [Hymenobacter terricola]|uniref:MAC/perforin domain-containing protein n=1 Tax=Hymenobacter terricola TaxID=2819236 RepID=UPI001B317C68|nr:MAC/perforin domain-containing protein [Hymenobacter terricola]
MPNSNATVQLINGSGILGASLNMCGPFAGSLLGQVYNMDAGDVVKGFPTAHPTVNFAIPRNATFVENTSSYATASSYSSREEYNSHFAAKANVEGSYMGFSASAETSFSKDVDNKTSSSFGALTANTHLYDLNLATRAASALSANLTSDSDYLALPTRYDAAQPQAFLRFFRKFGTHFVSGVQMGGRLEYSVAVHSSSHFTGTETSAKLKAEYKGVFADVSASASVDFKTADKKWFDSTERYVYVAGGDNSILASVVPAVDENNHDAFEKWLLSIATGGAAIPDVQVTSIDTIFSGDQATAVRDALRDYSAKYIGADISDITGRVRVAGTEVRPDLFSTPVSVPPRYSRGRLEVAVLDPQTLALVYANAWVAPQNPADLVDFFAPALAALQPYQSTKNILIVSMASLVGATHLMLKAGPAFGNFLAANCGAGPGLKAYFNRPFTGSDEQPSGRANYGLLTTFSATRAGVEQYAEPPMLHGATMMTFPKPLTVYGFLNPYVNGQGELTYGLSAMGLPPVIVRGTALHAHAAAEAETEAVA